jgi:cytochrome P450
MATATPRSADEVNLSTREFWQRPAAERRAAFALLRRERPVGYHPPADSVLLPPEPGDPGYWAVVRYDDVRTVSRAPEVFCSGQGVMFDDVPEDILDAAQSFLAMDAPRHTKLRGLVKAAFTPRQVSRIEDRIAADSRAVVDRFLEAGEGDFVKLLSERLPMMTINALLGVPEADRERLTHAADDMVAWNDEDVVGERHPVELLMDSLSTILPLAIELAEAREATPADDLMTELVRARVDGERLTHDEIGAFVVLLSVAGNDTTRHTTSHSALALWRDFPDQRRLLQQDVAAGIELGVEECLRWATPVMTFRRTATRNTELAGQPIAAGEKVVMFYDSANRDEAAFPDPDRFDVRRSPNRHFAFGGGGPHFCLGAPLARTQLRCILGELLTRVRELELGEPEPLIGNFIDGIKRLPCRVVAA